MIAPHRLIGILALTIPALLPGIAAPLVRAQAAPTPAVPAADWLQGWPMAGHDPQRTNRSPSTGPTQPHVLFTRPGFYPLLIGANGDIYGSDMKGIAALDATGQQKWGVSGCCGDGSSVLTASGTLFSYGASNTAEANSTNGTEAIAVRPDGMVAWRISPFGLAKGALSLAAESDIFAPVSGPHNETGSEPYINLNVISTQGNVTAHLPSIYAPALSPNGTIYGASAFQIMAFNRNGAVVWRHKLSGSPPIGPLVGQQGTVYVASGTKILAYRPSGSLLWKLRWRGTPLALAERADGVLLIAGRSRLGAVGRTGQRLWSVPIGRTAKSYDRTSLIVDAAGTAYVGSGDGKLRVVGAAGHVTASLQAGPADRAPPAAMLGADGRLVVSGSDGMLRVYGL